MIGYKESERWDLNPRPPEPHSGTLPGCATFRYVKYDLIFSRTFFISSKSFLRDGFSFLLDDLFAFLSLLPKSISSCADSSTGAIVAMIFLAPSIVYFFFFKRILISSICLISLFGLILIPSWTFF